MSYQVVYDKQSLRLDKDNYMTIALSGCSSGHDVNGNIDKHWSVLVSPYQNKPWATLSEFNTFANKTRAHHVAKDGYMDAQFGSYAGFSIAGKRADKVSFGNYKGLWIGAAKKAITVSALAKLAGVRLSVEVCPLYAIENGIEARQLLPRSGKELMRMYAELSTDPKTGSDVPVYIKVIVATGNDFAKDIRAVLFNKKLADISGCVIVYRLNGYVAGQDFHSIAYHKPKTGPHRIFDSRKQANNFIKKYNFGMERNKFQVISCG